MLIQDVLSDMSIDKNQCIIIRYDYKTLSSLETIKVYKNSDDTFLISVYDALLPIKFYKLKTLNGVKNKIIKIHNKAQEKHVDILEISEVSKVVTTMETMHQGGLIWKKYYIAMK